MSKVIRVGLVMKSLQADFFKAMQAGAKEFAKSYPDLELLCVGTQSQTEVTVQIELVRALINQNVDAIVLVPIDSKALVAPVVEAVKAGIKVVNIDIRLDEKLLGEAGVVVPFVGPDNYTAAYQVARCLCETLQSNDEVAIIEGLSSADNAYQRKAGFMQAINESHLKLVASQPADWETAKAASVFTDIWEQYPGIKALFCSNDAMALGALGVMKQRGVYLPVVGFDNDASIQTHLKDGTLLATVDIFSAQLAVFGIEHALKSLVEDIPTAGTILTPFQLIK